MMQFKDVRIGASVQKALRVMDPEQSTQGGKQARQPIALVAIGGEAMSLVFGWMDVAQKQAAFKDFDSVAATFAQRSGMQVDFARNEYEQVVAGVVSFLQSQGIQAQMPAARVTMAEPQGMQAAGGAPPAKEANLGLAIMFGGVGIAIGFGLGYVVFGM
ncbi:MAG: hypothetical protein P1V51_11255 [Deltaproteobacteria bacterium]|nr:hypothetical protein [Deltaproteobacteria bacterium]